MYLFMLFQQIQLYEDFARSRAKKGVEDTIHDVEKDNKPKAPATTHIFQVRRNIFIYKMIVFNEIKQNLWNFDCQLTRLKT